MGIRKNKKETGVYFHECWKYGHIFRKVGDYFVCVYCGFNKKANNEEILRKECNKIYSDIKKIQGKMRVNL